MSITVQARGPRRAEVLIHQEIGQDWLGDGLTSKRFAEQLQALGSVQEILVRINSPGGAVSDGVAIYNALRSHGARIEVVVEGLAASIASIIAMAGDSIAMGAGAMMMVHSPWTIALGNAEQMREVADVLEKNEGALVDIYAKRTGAERSKIQQLLAAETWLTGAEAVAAGFADKADNDAGVDAQAQASRHRQEFTTFAQLTRERLSKLSPLQVAAALQSLEVPTVTPSTASAAVPSDPSGVLEREKQRRASIRQSFSAGRSVGGAFADRFRGLLDQCLDDPNCTPAKASELLLAKLGDDTEPLAGMPGGARISHISISSTDFRAAATDALLVRSGIHVQQPHPGARDLATVSCLELARMSLSQSDRSSHGLTGMRLIKAALSTSDFPSLLENVLGKTLRAGYESDPQSHTLWVKRTQVPDFKTQSRLLLGSAPALAAINEGGEYTYGSMSENKATLVVSKYGKALSLTWETLVNDDLQTFMSIPQSLGAAARRAEADAVYTIFTANSGNGQAMQDSNNLFDSANHANVSATVGAISTATLGAGRALLRKQQALGNGGYLNLNPRFLIVPAESETQAEQVMAAATRHVTDTVASNTRKMDAPTPEWISQLQLVVEPRLNATYGFYLAAGTNQIDTVELATLEPDGGAPVLENETAFKTDAQDYKVRHVFVAKAIDWKGLVRVPVT